jgi:RNA polymerase sigma-70 factor (ECF subfamily)
VIIMELDTLLARCRQGDDLAWEALVRQYQGRVYAVAYHYMRDREEARDVAQEIFIKIYRGLGSMREGDRFLPWMLRLARNCCVDRLRRLKVRTPAFEVPVEEAPQIAAAEPSPEDSSLTGSRHGLLYRAIAKLGEKNREMILLREIQEPKLVEIAQMLGLPIGTPEDELPRARRPAGSATRRRAERGRTPPLRPPPGGLPELSRTGGTARGLCGATG